MFDVSNLWVVLTIICVVLLYIYGSYPYKTWTNLGVPSPPSVVPYFGHVHTLFKSKTGVRGIIHEWTQQLGKVFGVFIFRYPVLIVSDLDILKDVLVNDFSNYTSRSIFGGDLLRNDELSKSVIVTGGHEWKRARQSMTPSFSGSKLKLLTHYINTTARQLVEVLNNHLEAGSKPDAKTVFSAFALDTIMGPNFGLELNSQRDVNGPFCQAARRITSVTTFKKCVMFINGMFPFVIKLLRVFNINWYFFDDNGMKFFRKQLSKLIHEIRANEKESKIKDLNFLKLLMDSGTSKDGNGTNKMTTEEIIAQCLTIILAGYETTSTTLQWMSYTLARNQNVQKRVKEEIDRVVGDDEDVSYEHCQQMKYTDAFICETLRMYPPFIFLTREAKESRVLKGVSVPAKTGLIIPVSTISRDPELFENPDTFNPDRFLDDTAKTRSLSFLPFGFGPKRCIGARQSMVQLKIVLSHMLKSLTILDVSPRDVDIDDTAITGVPKQPIKLILGK